MCPDYIDRSQDSVRISVLHDGVPVEGQRVTLMSGWLDAWREPAFLVTKVTGAAGKAGFYLDDLPECVSTLTLTVTPDDPAKAPRFKPFTVDIPVCSSQKGWRRCTECGALFFRYSPDETGNHQDCPCGDRHTPADEEYRVIANSPNAPGQQHWRWCRRCGVLFLSGGENAEVTGKCHGGQAHDGTTSGHYVVARYEFDRRGYRQWRFCGRCFTLHCVSAEGVAGRCFDGGGHDIWAGVMFVVPTE